MPSENLKITTDEAYPSEVRNLMSNFTSTTDIFVSWEVPKEENGILGDYLIIWDDGSGDNQSAEVNTTNFLIDELVPCVLYNITVMAQTGAGYGEESYINATTDTEVPPAVTSLSDVSLASRSMTLTWDRPDTECEITGYFVDYIGEVLWGDNNRTENTTYVPGDGNNTEEVTLVQLTPYTNYNVVVTAATGAGNGTSAAPLLTQTLQDAPSQPGIKPYQARHKTLEIFWSEPEILNGILLWYQIILRQDDTIVATYNASSKQDQCVFDDLRYETPYNVTVEAWTGGGVSRNSVTAMTVDSPVPLIVGLTIFVIILVVLVVLGYVKRDVVRQQMKKIKPQKAHANGSATTVTEVFPTLTSSGPGAGLWRKINDMQESDGLLLLQEFSNLRGISYAGTTEVAAANPSKNRFINILAYDNSRVMLGSYGDYINANYIRNYDQSDYFIAAQGPLQSTLTDWWQMMLEQNVNFIIMLTNCLEKNKVKCHQYWPEENKILEAAPNLFIFNAGEQQQADYTIRDLRITDAQHRHLRSVKQYHFQAWPDFGVPQDPGVILTFIGDITKEMSREAQASDSHMVVHCSAGVGRTGTFICVWNLCHQYKRTLEVSDVQREVLAMRERRCNMVQTKEQLLFVYRCYAEYVSRQQKWPLADSWEEAKYKEFTAIEESASSYSTLLAERPESKWKNRYINILPYDHSIVKLQDPGGYINANFVTLLAERPESKWKNRYINILPYDHSIVKLQDPGGYINANFVLDHQEQPSFIAAQGPTDSTVNDFWQMVREQNVVIIVMLTNTTEKGKVKCAQYWPEESQSLLLPDGLRVTNLGEREHGLYVVRKLKLDDEKRRSPSRTTLQYHFLAWKDFGVPEDQESLLQLISAVKTDLVAVTPAANQHIVVHCSAGVGRTGSFIAVWNLCHLFKLHRRETSVQSVVLALRESRTKLVQTKDQYLYVNKCYEAFRKSPDRWPLPEYAPPKNGIAEPAIYENWTGNQVDDDENFYENFDMAPK
ncbi:receptor-type tyrosine-protein phosphatase epsilon-like [Hyalella azteca]|uniref:Receptor-type tyrosine-protein phosphatase epsilon-like n=1 Tax=Hyalella azteca TaxID=294128 RepID=A0A979FNE2_HYAAZ|nr:receptor-type tyrosine-protein phosphatase epsilon-like [Hyalella azteca]